MSFAALSSICPSSVCSAVNKKTSGTRDPPSWAAASSRRRGSCSNSSPGSNGRPEARRLSSYTSTAFTKGSFWQDESSTSRRGANERQEDSLHSERRLFTGRSNLCEEKAIRSLLFGKASLSDMRPDIYRLDLSQKDDVRFLYETQHRVDPELVPVKKHMTHTRWKNMHRSRVFDTTPPPARPAAATTPKKNSDGLGTLARFLLCPEGRSVSPVRGRGRCNGATGQAVFDLLRGRKVSESSSPQPRPTGKRHVLEHPADQLGRDMRSRDVPGVEISLSPRGIRTLKTVQMFERTQPKLTLPASKSPHRITRGTRSHSASSDNDIFGVRGRRENMMRRTRSASARSNDPYGSEDGDEVVQRRAVNFSHDVRENHRTGLRTNVPFGAEEEGDEPRRAATVTRRHQSPCGGGDSSRNKPIVPSLSLLHKLDHSLSPRTYSRESGGRKEGAVRKRYVNVTDVQLTNTGPAPCDAVQSTTTLLVSPRLRRGRALVPGSSHNKSNIFFSDLQAVPSPRRDLRHTQLRSSQMQGILSWGC